MIRPSILLFAALLAPEAQLENDPRTGTSAWEWYQDVTLPNGEPGGLVMVTLPGNVFDKSQDDLADLRLHTTGGAAVPYFLRIRRSQDIQAATRIRRQFNQATQADGSAEITIEMDPAASPEHNEVEITLSDSEYRRPVKVEGSDTDGPDGWRVLVNKALLINYHVDRQGIDIRRVRYPASRHRFVRVTVTPDASNAQDKPKITGVAVLMNVRADGRFVTTDATLGPREPVRDHGAPASAWPIEFGGLRVPISTLSFDAVDRNFSRPYHLYEMVPDVGVVQLVNGQWVRRASDGAKPLELTLPMDYITKKMRLVVMDNANAPLNITAVRAAVAAREIIFARPAGTGPLRLYYGNPSAQLPRYDFGANLPAELKPAPAEATLAPPTRNPDYQPPPKPWTERWPGLVYLALSSASVVLLALLGRLARTAVARHDVAVAASH